MPLHAHWCCIAISVSGTAAILGFIKTNRYLFLLYYHLEGVICVSISVTFWLQVRTAFGQR